MCKIVLSLLFTLCLTFPTMAQTKPAGIFQLTSCGDRPQWSSFALLVDTENFYKATECSRWTGLRWVLYLTASPYSPIDAHVAQVKSRLDAAQLTPFVIGLVDHEEWYENTLSIPPRWPIGQLDPSLPAHQWEIARIVKHVTSGRNRTLKRVFPTIPIVWLTSLVNDSPQFGSFFYRPIPDGVDVIALEGYVPAGHTWATTAQIYIQHALNTRKEPIVLVTQGFRWSGDPLWAAGPTEDGMAGTAVMLQHPRIVASWVFTWDGPGPTLLGLKQMPQWQRRYEQVIGVRE